MEDKTELNARKDLQIKLGIFLRDYRLKASISQAQLAEILGYGSGQYISNIERGLCAVPLNVLRQYAQVCKINTLELTDFITKLNTEYYKTCLMRRPKRSKIS